MFAVAFLSSLVSAWERSRETFWLQTGFSVSLTLRAIGLALLLGVPTGLVLTRLPRLANPVIAALATVQTVPSLVLLALMIPLLGIGQPAALFAAVVYSLFPIVLNTYVGIRQVNPAVRDAARGMGMTDRQLLWRVELPLGLPVLLAGVRAGAVNAAGMIVIAALIGAGGLGDYVVNGMTRDDSGLIWLGTLPVLALTFFLYGALGGIATLAQRNANLGMSLGGGLIVALSLYAAADAVRHVVSPRRADVVIATKDFTEGQVLSEVLKQMIEGNTGLSTEIKSNLGTIVILKALETGQIDAYPEYTGNLLTGKDALDLPVPEDRSRITAIVRAGMHERFGLAFLEPFGLNNTYAPSVKAEVAQRYGLKKISDLRRVPELRVVIDQSFLTRPDGWKGLIAKYDLHFARPPQQVSPNLLYKALEQGEADLVIGFATDWQIRALKLVVLDDDRGYFPSYHAAPLVREALLQRHPEVKTALDRLTGQIDDDTMRGLNYEVAVRRRSERDVVREFLRVRRLVPAQRAGSQ
jgi:osmoprotectant transport system permease protein